MIWLFILGIIGVVCIFISIFSSFEQRKRNLGGEVLEREKVENVTVYEKKRL